MKHIIHSFILLTLLFATSVKLEAQTVYRLDANDIGQTEFWTTQNLTNLVTPLNASSLTINYLRIGIPSVSGQSGKALTNNGSAFTWTDMSSLYQPLNANLTSISALTTTAFGRSVLETADAAALKTLAGLANVENTALSTWAGATSVTTLGTITTGTWSATAIAVLNGGTGATTAADARTNLGLVIGTHVQAYSANLTTFAGIAPSANVQSLLGAADYSAIRTLLSLGTAALVDTGTSSGNVPVIADFTLQGPTIGRFERSTHATQSAVIYYGGLYWEDVDTSGFRHDVALAAPSANRIHTLPNASGTIITTGNLSAITATGTITSGTWNGTDIALAYIAQGGATDQQALLWNNTAGTWEPGTISTGVTIGTTPVASGTAGRLLYETAGNKVGQISGATSDGTTLTLTSPVITGGSATGLVQFGIAIPNNTTATGISLGTITDTTARPFKMAQTWNNASLVGHAVAVEVTSTSSAGTGVLFSVGIPGSAYFRINENSTFHSTGSGSFDANLQAAGSVQATGGELTLGNNTYSLNIGGSARVQIFREGDYTLGLHNAANANKVRIYRTKTDAGNYERLALQSGSGYQELAAETAGSGTDDIDVRVTPAGAGGVVLGAGSAAVKNIFTATATKDFDLTAVIVEDLTMTVTGAAVGDVVQVGVPNGSVTATAQYFAWVSAADTVTIRCRTAIAGENPPSGSFRVTITRH